MRKALARRRGERRRFVATFERRGSLYPRTQSPNGTMLLRQVADEYGNVLCDHLWVHATADMVALRLQPGDRVSIEATVRPYRRGRGPMPELEFGLDDVARPQREEF